MRGTFQPVSNQRDSILTDYHMTLLESYKKGNEYIWWRQIRIFCLLQLVVCFIRKRFFY